MSGMAYPDRIFPAMRRGVNSCLDAIHMPRKLFYGVLGEFFGTFVLLFLGLSVNAQSDLSQRNEWINVNLGWGFAVTFAAFSVSSTSGGHLNPAVSVMLFTLGVIDIITLILYIIAQVMGAFLGAAATFCLYYDLLNHYDGGIRTVDGPLKTAGIFSTFPPEYLSTTGAFLDQFVGTGFLGMFVAAVLDKRNRVPAHMHQLMFGFVVMLIGTCIGTNLGYPINPARDFGPRLFVLAVYGTKAFTYPNSHYWLVPIFAPMIGTTVFAWCYHFFVGAWIEEFRDPEPDENTEKNSKPSESSDDHPAQQEVVVVVTNSTKDKPLNN